MAVELFEQFRVLNKKYFERSTRDENRKWVRKEVNDFAVMHLIDVSEEERKILASKLDALNETDSYEVLSMRKRLDLAYQDFKDREPLPEKWWQRPVIKSFYHGNWPPY